jgi:hypothetical protein
MTSSIPRWRWRKQALIVLSLWLTATILIVVQSHALGIAQVEYRIWARGLGGIPRVPADWWRVGGVFVPFVLIAAGLWLLRRHQSGWLRRAATLGLILLIPLAPLTLLVASARGPSSLDRVSLPSGKQFVLAIEPIPTDSVYTLYQPIGRFGIWWRQVAMLDYSEGGRFTGIERLIVSPDGNWLTVARAGIWTDCFRIVAGEPHACSLGINPFWDEPSYERDMKARSTEIQQLTGMTPPQ